MLANDWKKKYNINVAIILFSFLNSVEVAL